MHKFKRKWKYKFNIFFYQEKPFLKQIFPDDLLVNYIQFNSFFSFLGLLLVHNPGKHSDFMFNNRI